MPTEGDGTTLREGIADGERDASAATEKLLEEAIEEGQRYEEEDITENTGAYLQLNSLTIGGTFICMVGCLFLWQPQTQ